MNVNRRQFLGAASAAAFPFIFPGCTGLSVRKYAVNADEYVEELVIGASVERIDETAFFNVKKLQRVTVDPENQWFKSVDGVLYSKDGKRAGPFQGPML